jgi:Tol biopolymer transport system component
MRLVSILAAILFIGPGASHDPAIVSIGSPAWSPTRAEIAFDAVVAGSGHQLLITAPDGSGTRAIETRVGKESVGRPVWSPNGERFALNGFDGRTPFVAVASRLGTTPPLAVGFGETTPGSWSPDSTRLALNGVDPTNSPTGVSVVTTDGAPSGHTEWPRYGPWWSRRRGLIAYVWGAKKEAFGPEPGRDFVYTADSQGKHRRRLLRGSNPSWSSDGKLLAYTAARGIYVAKADGSRRRLVYRSHAVGRAEIDIHLLWAPRRRLIAVPFHGTVVIDVARNRVWRLRLAAGVFAAGSRLYIVDADGKSGHFVTPTD